MVSSIDNTHACSCVCAVEVPGPCKGASWEVWFSGNHSRMEEEAGERDRQRSPCAVSDLPRLWHAWLHLVVQWCSNSALFTDMSSPPGKVLGKTTLATKCFRFGATIRTWIHTVHTVWICFITCYSCSNDSWTSIALMLWCTVELE